jgi:hypothetical protein
MVKAYTPIGVWRKKWRRIDFAHTLYCNRIYINEKIQPCHAYLILLGISFDAEDIFGGGR